MEATGSFHTLSVEPGEKGFVQHATCTAVFVTLWLQTMSLQPTANAEYVAGEKEGALISSSLFCRHVGRISMAGMGVRKRGV